jgi:endonuclease G
MLKLNENMRFLTVLLLLFSGLVSSCDLFEKKTEGVLAVSVGASQVSHNKGQYFVNVQCSGQWTLALVSDEEVDWATLDVTSGTGDKSNVRLTCQENRTGHSRDLRIVLDNGSKWTDCSLAQLPKEENTTPTPTPTPSTNADPRKHKWMELPAMDDPDLGYYYHTFSMNGKTYRNYSFGWSQKDRVALWVAYPLSRIYMSGYDGRSEAWAQDPLLGSLSAAPFKGYAGDYARGHQLPSEDRQCCYEANAQTFYGTNIVPQIQENFNGGIWASLEGRVRDFARSADTLYVVTGVVVSSKSGKETDSYGNSVTVPDAFFKALLQYSKNSTFGVWNAAAFYYPHTTYSGGVQKSHSMSIDGLEQITGIDFFANLPEMIGESAAANVERQDPANSSIWW